MKSRIKYYLFISFAALLANACVDPAICPVSGDDERIPLNIDGSIQQVQTKATAQGFVDKDAVGLFAVNYTDNNTAAGTLQASGNQADNVKYVFDEPNQKWVPVRPVYYKNVNTHVDLYLYYPFQGTISDVNAANFEVQKDQSAAATTTALSGYEASDWMWGKGTDITPSESKVQVQLTHRLSAVQVTLTEGTGFSSGEFAGLNKSVIVTGTTRKATLDYATGDVTPVGGAQLDGIVMCPQNDGTFRAVVVPQTVDANVNLFSITIGNTSYGYQQGEAVAYQQGKQMHVSLTINKKSPSGEFDIVLGGTTITAWTEDLNTHGGEARQYFVVNLTTAGTLQTTIEAAGKNPAKIKNLKITGVANADDFYFMRDQMTILEAVNMKECRIIGGTFQVNDWETKEILDDVIPDNAFTGKTTLVSFVFPETLTAINTNAFMNTHLSGPLVMPDMVTSIQEGAFNRTDISGIQFPSNLETIGVGAFYGCSSCSGSLMLPESTKRIEQSAFQDCNFEGQLSLPDELEHIGEAAFANCGSFSGNLSIPERVTVLYPSTFISTHFSGNLNLGNVNTIGDNCFQSCLLSGELIIPEGIVEIPGGAFMNNGFTSVVFPTSLRFIEGSALRNNTFMTPVVFPEGLIKIGDSAFLGCDKIPSILLPSTLQVIHENAFREDYAICSIICNAIEPPTVQSGVFYGVAKDNFTVEVPAQAVKRYQAESGWSDFKRISAHYDFSISRSELQALNGTYSKTLTLRVPSGFNWSIQSKPDWVTVSPSSGTGKTDITITLAEMARTNDIFEVNEGTFNNPSYVNYKGRSGDVVFLLNDKEYTSTLKVEQYDSDYADGAVQTLHTHSSGTGIDIVFTGDGYSARDIAKGTFLANATDGYGHFFDVEPYKTYKNYFNVYAVVAMSDESGIGTLNTIVDTKFGSTFTQNRIQVNDAALVFAWAKKADAGMELSKSLVIMLQNATTYEGVTLLYTDGSAIACCPVSTDAYPYDFRGIIQHEAGGHGFGKLGDEYIYHNAFIQNCNCQDCEHPQGDEDTQTSYGVFKTLGWFRNLSMKSDPSQVPWAHLIYHPQYSDYVDIYEGGYMHSRGMYRSEATSCMNNNIPYYSAISRQAIVERIMYCAGQDFSLENFYAHDKDDFGPITKGGPVDRTFGVDPKFVRTTGQGPILMGDHPNVQ